MGKVLGVGLFLVLAYFCVTGKPGATYSSPPIKTASEDEKERCVKSAGYGDWDYRRHKMLVPEFCDMVVPIVLGNRLAKEKRQLYPEYYGK